MSPSLPAPVRSAPNFPRVSGDEPLGPSNAARWLAFSPRERG